MWAKNAKFLKDKEKFLAFQKVEKFYYWMGGIVEIITQHLVG